MSDKATSKGKVKSDAGTDTSAADDLLAQALGEVGETDAIAASESTEEVSDLTSDEAPKSDAGFVEKISALSASLALAEKSSSDAISALATAEVTIATQEAQMGTLKAAATKACRIYGVQLGLPQVDYGSLSSEALAIAFIDLDSKFKTAVPEGRSSDAAHDVSNTHSATVQPLHRVSAVK